jgi:hypothetical protein
LGGLLDISNNGADGVYTSGGSFGTWGNTTLANNAAWGIELNGGARVQVGTVFGSNNIMGNPSGGATATEESEISLWNINGLQTMIRGNGAIGVSVGFSSQATFFDGDQISDHTSAGVDVYANSQAHFTGANSVFRNGTLSDPLSAGIRVDGNSEAFLRGGVVSHNNGPGILALVNSSVDFSGVTFSGDSGGVIICDSSAAMVSDQMQPNSTIRCKTPHTLGKRTITNRPSAVPDIFSVQSVASQVQEDRHPALKQESAFRLSRMPRPKLTWRGFLLFTPGAGADIVMESITRFKLQSGVLSVMAIITSIAGR